MTLPLLATSWLSHVRAGAFAPLVAAVRGIVVSLVIVSCSTGTLVAQLTERIDVRVVNIDAVVTDREGNRVTGLTKEDFELLENGRVQPITNFHEVRVNGSAASGYEGTGLSPAPPRRFLLFVDTYSLHPMVRNAMVASMKRFIDSNVRGADQATIVSWNDGMRIITAFTDDKAELNAGLSSLLGIASPLSTKDPLARVQQLCTRSFEMARSGRMPMPMAYDECIGVARNETMAMTMRSQALVASLEAALAIMAGMDGKKILVLAGAQLPERPGQELFQWANALFATSPRMSGFDRPTATPEFDHHRQLSSIENVAKTANANGVTMYLLNVPTFQDVNAVNMSRSGVADAGADFAKSANTSVSFRKLARMTGGIAISRPGNLDEALDAIANDAGSWYSLGYRAASDDPREHAITVRTKNRNHIVRARESYLPKTPDDQMRDRTIANVFVPAPAGDDWPITIRTGRPGRSGALFTVEVEVLIPSTLTLLPQGSELVGGFAVYLVIGNSQGALSEVTKHAQPITLSPAGQDEFRSEPLRFTATLTVRPGENHLSVGVVDVVSDVAGFARATINAR